MPATIDPPVTPTAPATDTGVAQGAPSTGASPSSFRPPNPAFEGVKDRLAERLNKKAVPSKKPEPPSMLQPKKETKPDETKSETIQQGSEADTDGSASVSAESDEQNIRGQQEGTRSDDEQHKEGEAEAADATTAPKKEKKVSPWRIIDDYKKTTSELKAKLETTEKELTALKSGKPTAEVPKEIQERLTAAEKRVQEYEDELRFTNYQKHPEFVEKYQKPYEAEYARTMHKLEGVPVNLPDGTTRAVNAEDVFKLLMMPAAEAEMKAKDMFGDFAGTVIRRVEKLQDLFDAHQGALAEAKTKGVERQKQLQAQQETERAEMGKFINDTWSAANREATTDAKYGKYFSPVEGDQEGNATLAKGFDLVDKAFKEDPREPGISQEERAARIRRHVAMRNRAAAFGRLRRWVEQRDAKIAELQDALDEYAKSEPGQAGGTAKTTQTPSVPANPFARFEERLQKRAR